MYWYGHDVSRPAFSDIHSGLLNNNGQKSPTFPIYRRVYYKTPARSNNLARLLEFAHKMIMQRLKRQRRCAKRGGNWAKVATIATHAATTTDFPAAKIRKLAVRSLVSAALFARRQFFATAPYSEFNASKKHDTAPVWQAGPAGATSTSSVSPSQST